MSPNDLAKEHFARETAGHKMTVLNDAGPYRHLRFTGPNSFYWFDVITWPMNLTITGGYGTYTFRNDEEDILALFLRSWSPDYWDEKVRAVDHATGVRGWWEDVFIELVEDATAKWADQLPEDDARYLHSRVEMDVLAYSGSQEAAMRALADFSFDGRSFTGWDDWTLEGLAPKFRYNCLAVNHAARVYTAWKAGQ